MGPSARPGQRAPQEQAAPRPSLFSQLGELVGGGPSPALSTAQNAQAQREAILNASLMALLAGGRGDPTSAGLAQAILTGRASGGDARAQLEQAAMIAQQEAQRRELAQMASTADRAQLMQALSGFLGAGDMESAKMVIEALKTLPAPSAGGDARRFQFETIPSTGQVLRTNQFTGEAELMDVGLAPSGPEPGQLGQPTEVVDIDTGERVLAAFDKQLGRFRDVNTGRVVNAQPKPAAGAMGQQQTQSIATSLQLALNELKQFAEAPNVVAQWAEENPLAGITRSFLSPETQSFFVAKEQVKSLVTKLISGAAASEKEVERIARGFVPQAGEHPSVVKKKMNLLQTWVSAMVADPSVDPYEAALQLQGQPGGSPAPGGGGNRFLNRR
jgi:hypothetical protein